MPAIWTAPRILERLGWSPKSASQFPTLIKKYGIPAFLRVDPKNKFRRTYYSSSEALTAWELARSQAYRRALLDKQEEKRSRG